jgi:hypothetical protein
MATLQNRHLILSEMHDTAMVGTADGGTVVKVLCYKSEGHWFDSRWCYWNFLLT